MKHCRNIGASAVSDGLQKDTNVSSLRRNVERLVIAGDAHLIYERATIRAVKVNLFRAPRERLDRNASVQFVWKFTGRKMTVSKASANGASSLA